MSEAHRVPVIGLCGGVGAGKTEVARLLAELGCVVVNSDELAREALRDPAVIATLRRWWGDGVLDSAGAVDRSKVAAIVFNDPAERRRLEGLTHPWIERRRRAIFDAAPRGTKALVIDAPLLLEVGLDRECDAVIFVEADQAARLARVRQSRGWDERELNRREAAQLPLDEKRRRADDIIVNTGDLNSLREQVRRVFEQILLRHHSRG